MKTLLIVVLALVGVAVLFWALLLFMGWLASFVGEGTYTPEAKTKLKTKSSDKRLTSQSDTNALKRSQYEPEATPVLHS